MINQKDKKNKKETQKEEVLTKEDFLNTLKKVTATVPKSSEKGKSKTSEQYLSGDCNEKRTR